MRAAQHAILGAQHFSPLAKKNVARLFFAIGGEKKCGPFFLLRRRCFFFKPYTGICICCVCNMETTETGHWERHRSPIMANGEYSIIIYVCFPLFYRLTWVQRCWPRATPDFGSVYVISSFLLQDIPRHPDTRLFEVREAFKRSLLLVCRRIFAHRSHFFSPPVVLRGSSGGPCAPQHVPQQTPDH